MSLSPHHDHQHCQSLYPEAVASARLREVVEAGHLAMIGEPEVRLGAGDAAVWVTFILLAGTALGWVVGRWAKR